MRGFRGGRPREKNSLIISDDSYMETRKIPQIVTSNRKLNWQYPEKKNTNYNSLSIFFYENYSHIKRNVAQYNNIILMGLLVNIFHRLQSL